MEKALESEVQALIASAVKSVTDQVGQLADAVKPVGALVQTVADMGKNVSVLADTLGKLPPAALAAGKEGATKEKEGKGDSPKYLTPEDLTRVLDERETKHATSAKRDAYIAEKLKDVPAAYRAGLGTDESKWATEEQAIRQQVQTDLKTLGFTVPDKGGAPNGSKPLTEIANPKDLPTADFAKNFLPKPAGAEVASAAK